MRYGDVSRDDLLGGGEAGGYLPGRGRRSAIREMIDKRPKTSYAVESGGEADPSYLSQLSCLSCIVEGALDRAGAAGDRGELGYNRPPASPAPSPPFSRPEGQVGRLRRSRTVLDGELVGPLTGDRARYLGGAGTRERASGRTRAEPEVER